MRKMIPVTHEVHQDLIALAGKKQEVLGRRVSLNEVIDDLLQDNK